MLCPEGGQLKVGQFALVSYLPDPLAEFLDSLRLELTPRCNPHAHVTILPPRPLSDELKETIHRLASKCRLTPTFEVTLGEVEVFPISNVIFVSIKHGVQELRSLYRQLNSGPLSYAERFPYHPHITIAQNMPAAESSEGIQAAAATARKRWAEYPGSRTFRVDTLSFVQQVAPNMWVDLAELALLNQLPDTLSA